MDDRKQQLIGEAIDRIRTAGYDSFSYADLAAATGITKASIHHHFPKKEDLGGAVLDTLAGMLPQLLAADDPRPAAEALRAFLYKGMDLSQPTIEAICPLTSLEAEIQVIPPGLRDRVNSVSAMEVDLVAALLQRGLDQGQFGFDRSAGRQAQLLMSAYKGALIYGRTQGMDWFVGVIDALLEDLAP